MVASCVLRWKRTTKIKRLAMARIGALSCKYNPAANGHRYGGTYQAALADLHPPRAVLTTGAAPGGGPAPTVSAQRCIRLDFHQARRHRVIPPRADRLPRRRL